MLLGRKSRTTHYEDQSSSELAIKEKELTLADGTVVKVNGPISISYTLVGWHDPGVCTGPVEQCYPEEGEEEYVDIEVFHNDGEDQLLVSEDLAQDLLERSL